jgi:hypothetical protein
LIIKQLEGDITKAARVVESMALVIASPVRPFKHASPFIWSSGPLGNFTIPDRKFKSLGNL